MRPRRQSGYVELRGTKRKYWYGHYSLYIKGENGNTQRKKTGDFLGYKSEMTKLDAEDKLQQIIYRATGQGVNATDKVTLEWFWKNRFLVARKSGWSDATESGNMTDWRLYIAPALGELKLSEIEQFRVQLHFNELAEQDYSKSVIQKSKTLLSSILSYAVDLEFLPRNPMISASGRPAVKMPKVKRREKPTLTEEHMTDLINLLVGRDRLILLLAYYFGLSAEEVFGLTWDCLSQDILRIRHVAWRGTLYRDTTKREARRRDLPLHPELYDMIVAWQRESGGKGTGLMFPGKDGESPMWPNVWLQKRVMPFASRLGISNVTFQIMRRSFSTENLERDPKSVQAIMGHARLDVTANIYAQAQLKKMAKLLDDRWASLGLTTSVQ